MSEFILELQDLQKFFPAPSQGIFSRVKATNKAVNGVSLSLGYGETLGVVGESGCGKSTLARTAIKLYEPTSGKIFFEGEEITKFSASQMKPLREKVQMIFQDPYSSLNPRHTVGGIISASFHIHKKKPAEGIEKAVKDLMDRVGLNPEHFNRFPHEFSGGQRQRVGIARALALKPKLIVADEPVSALDVSIQAQVINLLDDLRDDFGLSYLFIAHDLSVVRHIADRVAVMYLGKVMELATTEEIFNSPHHPYTKALLTAIPIPDPVHERQRKQIVLSGDLPTPSNPPTGCVFSTRCYKAQDKCRVEEPPLLTIGTSQLACHFPE